MGEAVGVRGAAVYGSSGEIRTGNCVSLVCLSCMEKEARMALNCEGA